MLDPIQDELDRANHEAEYHRDRIRHFESLPTRADTILECAGWLCKACKAFGQPRWNEEVYEHIEEHPIEGMKRFICSANVIWQNFNSGGKRVK
jgi:hypothetical protein